MFNNMLPIFNRGYKPRDKYKAQYEANLTFMNEMEKWYNIAVGRFDWQGLPDELTSADIEKVLYLYGAGSFVKDSITDELRFLPIYNQGQLNIYGDVFKYGVRALNGQSETTKGGSNLFLNNIDGVICKATMNYYPTYLSVLSYIEKMVDIEGAMMVNINSNKTPIVLSGEEEEVLSLKNSMKKISSNEYGIYKDNAFNTSKGIQVLQTGAPYLADKFAESYHEIENRLFTILGINHTAYEKKERLVVGEVEANDEYLYFNINTALNLRKQAAERVNKLFGTNISVDLKKIETTYDKIYDENEETPKEEAEE